LCLAVVLFFSLLSCALYFYFAPALRNQKQTVIKNDHGRTNILLLGAGGASHEGPDLTDTIIVASAKTATPPAILLISVPRDIYLDSLGDKINSAYATGKLERAKAAAGEVTGLPIHYAVKIDFAVFERIIDILGGIEITVPRGFTDDEYPAAGKENDPCGGDPELKCRYEKISFSPGRQKMDGATALKYARSRKAEGDEGTDFARSFRQQLVIGAAKDKVFSAEVMLNFPRLLEIYRQLADGVVTDITPAEAGTAFPLISSYRHAEIRSFLLDLNFLENPPEDNRGWILLPKDGRWTEIHKAIQSQLPAAK
jgi:anionic cell wall polymer biosynthesis LytR-Cps2A-Psr (LCP) family protein